MTATMWPAVVGPIEVLTVREFPPPTARDG
jgi:hypothetical protein